MANLLNIWDKEQNKYISIPAIRGEPGIHYGPNEPIGNNHPVWIDPDNNEEPNFVASVNGHAPDDEGNVDIWQDILQAKNEAIYESKAYNDTFVRPNLLDNWYFAGAEIWARAGANYYSLADGTLSGQLPNDIHANNDYYYPEFDGFLVDLPTGGTWKILARDCYQKEGGPVNQRRWNTFEANANWRYGIDRWRIGQETGSAIITGKGLLLRASSVFMQYFTDNFTDVTLTVSALDSEGNIYCSTRRKTDTSFGATGGKLRFGGVYDGNLNLGYIQLIADADVTIVAAKLELGSTQTLAHLEGDKWVLNEIPNYGE